MNRRAFLAGTACFCSSLHGLGVHETASAQADKYPSRPITLVVPFPSGGPLDLVARSLADRMSQRLKQPFVVENKSGANGNLGAETVARAAPDGYTLLFVLSNTLTVNPSLYKKLQFKPDADLLPIAVATTSSLMLVVHPSIPVNSVSEFVAFARNEPIVYAHAGYGSPGHVVMEYFRLKAGFQTSSVPYRGNAPLVTDLLAGQIKAGFVSTAGVINYVHSGKLKGIAVSAAARSELAPSIPTIAESGYPDFKVETDFVLLAPQGTPQSVVTLLEHEIHRALQSADLVTKFRALDITVLGLTGPEASARISAERALFTAVIKDANLQID